MINKNLILIFEAILLVGTLSFVSAANYQFQNSTGTDLMTIFGANGNVTVLNHLFAGGFINSSTDLCTTSGICLTNLNASLGNVNNSLVDYVPYTGATGNVNLNAQQLINVNRVGIGISGTTGSPLEINSTTDATITLKQYDNGNNYINFYNRTGRQSFLGMTSDTKFSINNNLIVDTLTGNVGIGTVNPTYILDLSGTHQRIRITNTSGSSDAELGISSQGGGFLQLLNSTGSSNTLLRSYGDSYINSGDVGIGTIYPTSKLQIDGTDAVLLRLNESDNGAGVIQFSNTDNQTGWYAGISGAENFGISNYIDVDSQPMFTIKSTGNVGIGTTSPGNKLEVNGTINAEPATNSTWGVSVTNPDTNNVIAGFYRNSAGNGNAYLYNSTGTTGVFLASQGNSYFNSGSLGVGTTTPDNKLTIGTGYLGIDYSYGIQIDNSTGSPKTALYAGSTGTTLRAISTAGISFENSTGTRKVVIEEDGDVGIGTTSPSVLLTINKANIGLPAISGTTQTNGGIRISSSVTTNQVLDIGTGSLTDGAWLQSTRADNLSLNYNLLLNPNGGNVGIGTTSPAATLHINGDAIINETLHMDSGKITNLANGTSAQDAVALSQLTSLNSSINSTLYNNYIPYTGAISNVDLGLKNITTAGRFFQTSSGGGVSSIFNNYTSTIGTMIVNSYDGNDYGNFLITSSNDSATRENFFIQGSTGEVGIGTTNPTTLLHLNSSVPAISLTDADTGAVSQISANGAVGNLAFYSDVNNVLANSVINFFIDGSEKVRIDSSGNVGIGISSPDANLHVWGNGSTANFSLGEEINSARQLMIKKETTGTSLTPDNVDFYWSNNPTTSLGDLTFYSAQNSPRVIFTSTGNVGIGTTSPGAKLTVSGNASITGDLIVDTNTLFVNSSSNNVGIGTTNPGQKLSVSGNINIADGYALYYGGSQAFRLANGTDTFYTNVQIGQNAGNTSSQRQTVVGYASGYINKGTFQSALGYYAGYNNSASYQTAIGYQAGEDNLGTAQTVVGGNAGNKNTGSSQTAVGYAAGYNTSGNSQSAFGYQAGYNNNGTDQTAIGYQAGKFNTGNYQTSFGYYAGLQNLGSHQTAIGHSAGYNNTGNRVISLGYAAAYNNSGSDVVALGYQAGLNNVDSNQFIVKQANVNSVPLIQGNFLTGNVGINTTSPTHTLNVVGGINVSDTNVQMFTEGGALVISG